MKVQESRKIDLTDLAEVVIESNSPRRGATDLLEILRRKEISLHKAYFAEKFDALISCRADAFHIHLNLRMVDGDAFSPRARFTIAHELAHFFIPEHRLQLIQGKEPHGSQCGMFDGADSIEEEEADHFAANLLMPPSRFVPAAAGLGSPLTTILALSKDFKSSLTSTALQYTRYVSDRCIVMRWRTDGTLAWSKPGASYRIEGYRTTRFKKPDQLPHDSATGRVIAGTHPHDVGTLTMATVFHNVAQAGERNAIVSEEAIALGDYGFLTIISDRLGSSNPSPRALRRRERRDTNFSS